jgi:hypothetical protein
MDIYIIMLLQMVVLGSIFLLKKGVETELQRVRVDMNTHFATTFNDFFGMANQLIEAIEGILVEINNLELETTNNGDFFDLKSAALIKASIENALYKYENVIANHKISLNISNEKENHSVINNVNQLLVEISTYIETLDCEAIIGCIKVCKESLELLKSNLNKSGKFND